MKKKNTKSCFTWLKNIFVSHPINKASLCLTLSMVSLVSVGFSSWMLVGRSAEMGPIDVTVGDVVASSDYGDSAYYIQNSEKGLGYDCYLHKYQLTDSVFSLTFKIRPDLVKAMFQGKETTIYFGLKYTSSTNTNYFDETNGMLIAPAEFVCKQSSTFNTEIYSSSLKCETSQSTSYSYELGGEVLLYSESQPSLYSISHFFQKRAEYLYFDVEFVFQKNESATTLTNELLTTEFKFVTSLGGISA